LAVEGEAAGLSSATQAASPMEKEGASGNVIARTTSASTEEERRGKAHRVHNRAHTRATKHTGTTME
jgi:hypothetical protein